MVGVIGCGGETVNWGWPSESFVIDGTNYEVHNDPTADPHIMFFNVEFFASPVLTPGVHTLVVTNLNGTAPNRLWLDHFWYVPSDVANNTATQSTFSSTPSLTFTSTKPKPLTTSMLSQNSTTSSSSIVSASQPADSTASLVSHATSSRAPQAPLSVSALPFPAVASGSSFSFTPFLASPGSLAPTTTVSTLTSTSTSISATAPASTIIGGAVGGAVAVLLLARALVMLQVNDGIGGSWTSSPPARHRPRLSMRTSPALSTVSLLAEEQHTSLQSAVTSAPLFASAHQRKNSGPQSRPCSVSTTIPQTSGSPPPYVR
ncbi:hypothetical protein BC628DRAFT_1410045 [Trametes gibbosa]|nr:hypothetical protein BC628DRAFT_1410045 [Trametes gibbosa]